MTPTFNFISRSRGWGSGWSREKDPIGMASWSTLLHDMHFVGPILLAASICPTNAIAENHRLLSR